jgi:hypothetical protein
MRVCQSGFSKVVISYALDKRCPVWLHCAYYYYHHVNPKDFGVDQASAVRKGDANIIPGVQAIRHQNKWLSSILRDNNVQK